MIKQLFLFFKLLPFLLFTNVADELKDDFSIAMTTVEKVEKPGEFIVKLNFVRGGVKGFAKLTEQLPKGVTAEAVDIGDATFTCESGMLKILWLNLPDDKNFEISYKIIVDATAPVELNLGGKFSYLDNNEKRVYSIPGQKIVCASADELVAMAKAEAEKNKKITPEATVVRKIKALGNDVFEVELHVEKKGIEGFVKMEEFVPMGAKVQENLTENAVFSFINKKVKFVWMSTPPAASFKVSYTLDLSGASNKDPLSLKGEFSFLDENETRKVIIRNDGEKAAETTAVAEVIPPAPVDKQTVSTPPPIPTAKSADQKPTTTVVKPEEKATETKAETPAVTPKEAEAIVPKDDSVVDVPAQQKPQVAEKEVAPQTRSELPPKAPETTQATANKETITSPASDLSKFTPPAGLVYRVQIAAGKNLVDAVYFEKRHTWSSEFFIENHEGWVKYTTGKHAEYKQARDAREQINAGNYKFDGPFVTAYNDGQRITVQEALMISKQKWFK